MPETLLVIGLVAFFAVGAAYLVATARILARSGDIDEPLSDDGDDQHPSDRRPRREHEAA
jgi:hypothetical protein